jgi:DNA repair photolyase
MARYREPIRGRGTQAAPPNRFESAALEPEPETGFDDELAPDPRTQYLRDASRSAIARNQSPDVGFDVSINPYRGCEHGCIYCLSPDTPVLHADMTWRRLGEIRIGDVLVGFDEHPPARGTRKLRPATVENVWRSRKETLRLVTRESEVVATAEHRWLQARNFRWWRTSQLAPGKELRRIPCVKSPEIDDDYRAGYLAGLSLGDGTYRYEPGWRSDKLGFPAAYWRVALNDREPLERVAEYLKCFGVEVLVRPFSGGPLARKPMSKVETRSLSSLAIVDKILHVERSSASYRRGFVAGFFDAEGHSGDSLRISQVDIGVLERVSGYAAALGFRFRLEKRAPRASAIRLLGSVAERMRFFAVCRPAIRRKFEAVWGREPAYAPEPIEAIEPAGVRDVLDIQTSTGTFFAAGLATHNCYARPSHEYLGFSSGLDFETRILVKHELPELLRGQLARPSWKPQVIGISGVTDAYQPVERKLRLTRRCLEVLADFRNPCSLITKSRLVARDADVLQELARHQAVSVTLSLTSLDPVVARKMEPRAAQPRARLAAIEALARAGVPVGVNLAPIVPGLTDHEIPALVAAAAAAGARWAGWQMVRLPYSVKDLFSAWLADHFPDRREKILHRIESIRDGKLNATQFGVRHRGVGIFAEQIADLVALSRRRHGIPAHGPALSIASFRRPGGGQLSLL